MNSLQVIIFKTSLSSFVLNDFKFGYVTISNSIQHYSFAHS